MAMIQDIIEQLMSMGLGGSLQGQGYAGLSQISPENIASALGQEYGLTSEQLPSSLFQRIPSEFIKGSLSGTYSPLVESTGQSLLQKMLSDMYGKKGVQASGGFAGSGQQQRFTGGIKDVYGKGMADVLKTTGQSQAQSLQSIQDMINQWQSQALQVKGYQ